jgi:TPR repeat protein
MVVILKKYLSLSCLSVSILIFAMQVVFANNLIGAPVDPYDPQPEKCGKDGITPDVANQHKKIIGDSIIESTGVTFSKVAFMYLKGCGGIKQDLDEAKYWMELAAKQKDPIAIINLGWMIQNGIGFDVDKKKSESMYSAVINGDSPPSIKKKAKAALGELTGNSALAGKAEQKKTVLVSSLVGTPVNPFDPHPEQCGKDGITPDIANQHKKIIGDSIIESTGITFSKVAFIYLKGCGGIKQDFDEAKFWMENGAKQNDVSAIFNLGWMYQNGIVVEKNLNKAKELYNQAVKSTPKLASLVSANLSNSSVAKADVEVIDVNAGAALTKSASTSKISAPLRVSVKPSEIDSDGKLTIAVQSSNKLVSLKINGRDEGEAPAGIRNIARAVSVGTSKFKIEMLDEYGQAALQEISVTREVTVVAESLPALNPSVIKVSKAKDAIALIIGIENYKNAPKAEFAESDASQFYDYARKALGVPDNRIKLLQGSNAGKFDIIKQLKTWLAAEVNAGTTDVYVFYSGHGLASADGKTSYILPYDADTALLDETSLKLTEFINSIESTKPKSIVLFMDSCYSGQGKNGSTLLASARPLSINVTKPMLASNVTILTSAAGDQIAISALELRHGLFSYFLMKGMEGAADTSRDGTISMQELHQYVATNVSREATRRGKQQSPTLQGSGELILVGK